jgi:hypothetical protein
MIGFVKFYLWTFKQVLKWGFFKSPYTLENNRVVGFSCAYMLKIRASTWALDQMEKFPSESMGIVLGLHHG